MELTTSNATLMNITRRALVMNLSYFSDLSDEAFADEIFFINTFKTHIYIRAAACVLATLSFFFNSAIIVIFIHMSQKKKFNTANFMFCMQAVTDISVTICTLFFAFYLQLWYQFYNSNTLPNVPLVLTWQFLFNYAIILSPGTLLVITLDRFIAIMCPLHHRSYVTKRRVVIVVMIMFAIPIAPSVLFIIYIYPMYFITHYGIPRPIESKYYLIMGALGILCLLAVYVLMIISYRAIKKSLNKRICRHEFNKMSSKIDRQEQVQREKKKQLRILIIIVSMVVIYTITFAPGMLNVFFKDTSKYLHYNLTFSFRLLYFSNAFINPLLTLFYKDDYQKVMCLCFNKMSPKLRQSTTVDSHQSESKSDNQSSSALSTQL